MHFILEIFFVMFYQVLKDRISDLGFSKAKLLLLIKIGTPKNYALILLIFQMSNDTQIKKT